MIPQLKKSRRSFLSSAGMAVAGAQFGILSGTASRAISSAPLPNEGDLPSLGGAIGWLNSSPLTAHTLRNKVVLIDFWTYSCINWRRTLPYLRAWATNYKQQVLVVKPESLGSLW